MPSNRFHALLLTLPGIALLICMVLLWPASQVSAQCGSQASSCKNCHETQGQKSVNNDGTGWHQSHAFGDFCYLCHAGNNQSMDKAVAHAGMVAPLSDINSSCASCHPTDTLERAKVYATALGVEISTGSNETGGPSTATPKLSIMGPPVTAENTSADLNAPAGMVTNSNEVIDYNLRYEGKSPVNWGNIILVTLIILVAGGGGAFVYANERKLRSRGQAASGQPAAKTASQVTSLQAEGYSDEVIALLPHLSQLTPAGQYALRRLLEDPAQASELLISLSRLDTDLLRRVRNLDREGRALLLALTS